MAAKDKFCSQCGLKAVTPQSEREAVEMRHVSARLKALAADSKTLSTEKNHERTWRRFGEYMTTVIGRDPTDANPYHCVGYIMTLDDNGTEILHDVACPFKTNSTKKRRQCDCPLRAKAGSVDTNIGWLSACFRALAISGEYDPRTCSGNPCRSAVVRCYRAATAKEQLRKGVAPRQALVFDGTVYNHMICYCLQQAGEARGRAAGAASSDTGVAASASTSSSGAASSTTTRTNRSGGHSAAVDSGAFDELQWVQTALMFCLAYNTFNRGVNIVEITWNDIEVFTDHTGTAALHLHCGMSKTAGKSKTRHTLALTQFGVATVGTYNAVCLYNKFVELTGSDCIPYGRRNGYMFRSRIEVADVHVPTKYLQARLATVITALGFEKWRITVHSFRASGAIAAISAGLPMDLVMYRAGWSSPEMMEYYTYLRQILGLPELTAAAEFCVEATTVDPALAGDDTA